MGFVGMLIARWHALRRGDVVAIFLVAAIFVIAVVAFVEFPVFDWTGTRRSGPDWECSNPGYGGPVCVKKPAPSR
jgi:hypothetical protein